ncbi:MAG: hypothetical protein ABH886_03785 [Candidatus Desantisbacteria bacterium]
MMDKFNTGKGMQGGIIVPELGNRAVLDPTAIRSLLTDGADLNCLNNPVKFVCILMALYHHGVPLSVLGRWCHVDKTTVQRWITGLGLEIWGIACKWIQKKVKSTQVHVDEKWIKIGGKWRYWFVVLDIKTNIPILSSLLDSRGEWSLSSIILLTVSASGLIFVLQTS